MTINAFDILFALVGLLLGLIVAEVAFKRAAAHANHVVPATIVNNSHKIVRQKIVYYGFFCTIIAAEYLLRVDIPDPVYWLTAFAIVGGDVQKLASKFFRLK